MIINQWIESCAVQRMSLKDGLVLTTDDYNELVISGRLYLTLPPTSLHPAEVVEIDPTNVSEFDRPLFDLAGSVCTEARCTDNGTLHVRFSRGHAIEVAADTHIAAWELYGRHHGYMACLPGVRVRTVRHDLPDDEDMPAEIASTTP